MLYKREASGNVYIQYSIYQACQYKLVMKMFYFVHGNC